MDNNKITCTLTDKELVKKVEKVLDRLMQTGGRSFIMSIPAEPNNDPDLLIAELLRRFKTSKQQALNIANVSHSKAPLGLKPKHIFIQERRDEIYAAICGYLEERKKIPQEWKDEFNSYCG